MSLILFLVATGGGSIMGNVQIEGALSHSQGCWGGESYMYLKSIASQRGRSGSSAFCGKSENSRWVVNPDLDLDDGPDEYPEE